MAIYRQLRRLLAAWTASGWPTTGKWSGDGELEQSRSSVDLALQAV